METHQDQTQQNNPGIPAAPIQQTAPSNDTLMAILAYVFFVIPLVAGGNSPFVRYHTNQGLVLFIASVAGWVVSMFLWILFFILPFYYMGIFALWVIGIINAAKGEMKPLPIIGGIQILK